MGCKPRTKAQDYELADRIVRAQHEYPFLADAHIPVSDEIWRVWSSQHPVKTEIEVVRRVLARARV